MNSPLETAVITSYATQSALAFYYFEQSNRLYDTPGDHAKIQADEAWQGVVAAGPLITELRRLLRDVAGIPSEQLDALREQAREVAIEYLDQNKTPDELVKVIGALDGT